jgi:hypothetical protein
MPTYIIGVKLLENRTDKEFAESIKRVAQVRTAHQGQLIASYVTFGRYVFSVNYFCRSATIIFAGCRQVDV